MYDFWELANLPVLSPKRRVLQVSSFDRQYENADWGQYLYEEGDSRVLFDEPGCGCIKSIWMAVTSDETFLDFYFGGESTPRYSCTTRSLFNGGIPELAGPACTFEERGHYDEDDCHAGNCFTEISFENGLRITARGEKKVFYHIIYETYADGMPDGADMTKEMENSFAGNVYSCPSDIVESENAGAADSAATVGTHISDSVLKVGYNTLFEFDSAGVIREFTVEVEENAPIEDIYLDIRWDKCRASQVATPLSHLFAQPLGCTDISSYAVCSRKSGNKRIMSIYLPMPFWQGASFCFVNRGDSEVGAKITLRIGENSYDKENTGYFCADYEHGDTQLFSDWKIGEFNGRGQIVGLVQTCIGGQYCEGNEHFYINGALTPRINGTGTEDLYLACYWPNHKYDSPCAGCVSDVFIEGGSTLPGAFKNPAGYYRYFLDAPIAYEDGIRLYIQHGAVCQTYSHYSTLCLSYRIEEASLELTDMINLESEASMMLHAYSANGESYTHAGRVESDMRAAPITRRGFRTDSGSVIFKAAIIPENDGVILRRLYDQSISNRGAEVYIDGEFAGVWMCPGVNTFFTFADDDFYVPARLCRGKELIDVEIRSGGSYSDFEYKVYTRKAHK